MPAVENPSHDTHVSNESLVVFKDLDPILRYTSAACPSPIANSINIMGLPQSRLIGPRATCTLFQPVRESSTGKPKRNDQSTDPSLSAKDSLFYKAVEMELAIAQSGTCPKGLGTGRSRPDGA